MRLNEFADLKDYTQSIADVEGLMKQLERIRPRDNPSFVTQLHKPQGQRDEVMGGL